MADNGQERAFNAFRVFAEGITCPEFRCLMESPQDKRNASARLSQFVKEGLAVKDGSRLNEETGHLVALYKPTGRDFADRILEVRAPRRKRRRPTDAELVELRQWKAEAIERFPELGVDPLVKRARERLSAILRAEGSETKAVLVERGDLDDSETMRVVLSLLRGEQS